MYHIDFIKETLDQCELYKLTETGKVYGIFVCKWDRLHFYLIQMFCQAREGTEDFLSSFLILICILCIFNFSKKEQWSKHKLEEFCKKKFIYYTQNIEPLFINRIANVMV